MKYHNMLIDLAIGNSLVDKRGVCLGATMRWIEACLLGEEDLFDRRMKYMEDNHTKLKGILATKKFPTEEQDQDVLAFLDSLVLFQEPRTTERTVFSSKNITNRKTDEISKLASSEAILEKGGLETIGQNLRLFSENEFSLYLKEIAKLITESNPLPTGPITIKLSTPSHAMGMSYEIGKGWKFMNINQYPAIKVKDGDEHVISKKIFQNCKGIIDGCVPLSATFITTASNPATPALRKNLSERQAKYVITPKIASWTSTVNLLWEAASDGNVDLVEQLIQKGADVNKINEIGASPIWMACQEGHLGVVRCLLTANADVKSKPNIKNTQSITYQALLSGYPEIAIELIKHNADLSPSSTGVELLHAAAGMGYLNVLQALFEKEGKTKINNLRSGCSPLYFACQNGHLAVVKYLVESGAKLVHNDRSALVAACLNGHTEVVNYLYDKDTESDRNELLFVAIMGGHLDIIKILVANNNALDLGQEFEIDIETLKKIPMDKASTTRLNQFIANDFQINNNSETVRITAKNISTILGNKSANAFLSEQALASKPKTVAKPPKTDPKATTPDANPPKDANSPKEQPTAKNSSSTLSQKQTTTEPKLTSSNPLSKDVFQALTKFKESIKRPPKGFNKFLKSSEAICDQVIVDESQKSYNERVCGEISKLAEKQFKHRHPAILRALADMVFIPIGLGTLGAAFALKYYLTESPTFFLGKTKTLSQKKLGEALELVTKNSPGKDK